MIIDEICKADEYFDLSEGIRTALRFLQETDMDALEPGRHTVEGDRVFAIVESYQTKPMADGFWEAHLKHLDVQCVISGEEQIGYAPVSSMVAEPYDEDRDFYKLKGNGNFVTLRPGMFALLKPQDAHMPGISIQESRQVKKIVIKVRI
ncbi:MAG: YhcH/YjgK/YiaL family protein [Verrucomicrobia bacterium]|nr:YhcH/YjgK/YiaL family protein [Verrucomicrobiota bacterium]